MLGTSPVVQWLRIHLPIDTGSIPGRETKIPHVHEATKPLRCNYWAHEPQLESPRATTTEPMHSGAYVPQLERSLHATTREKPARCNEDPTCRN